MLDAGTGVSGSGSRYQCLSWVNMHISLQLITPFFRTLQSMRLSRSFSSAETAASSGKRSGSVCTTCSSNDVLEAGQAACAQICCDSTVNISQAGQVQAPVMHYAIVFAAVYHMQTHTGMPAAQQQKTPSAVRQWWPLCEVHRNIHVLPARFR